MLRRERRRDPFLRRLLEGIGDLDQLISDSFLIDSSDWKVTATSAQIERQPSIEVNGLGGAVRAALNVRRRA